MKRPGLNAGAFFGRVLFSVVSSRTQLTFERGESVRKLPYLLKQPLVCQPRMPAFQLLVRSTEGSYRADCGPSMPSASGEGLTVAVSSYRYETKRTDEPLRTRLVELAREKPRFGYRRRMYWLLSED